MNYSEALTLLYEQLPMFSRVGAAAYKKDLDNTLKLCAILGNPQQKIKTIHIAGTNGKGSVSHFLAAIFQQAGYKTGLYTSPHLKDFRERIKINGQMCPEAFVASFTERMIPALQSISPSFFELTVAMAFEYFANENVDIAIIETGLGGRLDSTNVITPELSIITNIGWDHMNLLGNTLQDIAKEKAGIIKQNIPVVIGETLPETLPIFLQHAQHRNAPIHFAEKNYITVNKNWPNAATAVFEIKHLESIVAYQTDLPGIYQGKNLCTVLTAIDVMKNKGWHIETSVLKNAIADAKNVSGLHGRWELIQHEPNIILDVAHNEAGIKNVLTHLDKIKYQALHIVMGMVKDKDIDIVLSLLPKYATYYFTKADIPRALDEKILASKASGFKLNGESYADVNTAIKAANSSAAYNDFILVCGSVFLVGEVDIRKIKKPLL